jgi:hypothetical protein
MCPECGHADHIKDWCMVTVPEPCEDCGAPTQRCRCTSGKHGKAPQGGGSPVARIGKVIRGYGPF